MVTLKSAGYCLALIFGTSGALADCLEDSRQVSLDSQNVVRLRSYLCRSGEGPNDARLKVEFHRFSDIAASMIVAKSYSSLLRRTIGAPKIIENDVFRAYAELIREFGKTDQAPQNPLPASVNAPGSDRQDRSFNDRISGRSLRTLTSLLRGDDAWQDSYPAAAELKALKGKVLPKDLKYYYSVRCDNETDWNKAVCSKYDRSSVRMIFWRNMREDDITNYRANLAAYNAFIKNPRDRSSGGSVPTDLRLAMHLADGKLPNDFIFLIGERHPAACGELPAGLDDWAFRYVVRHGILDAVLIENVSRERVEISGLFGTHSSSAKLREISSEPSPIPAQLLSPMSQSLGPGERLLIPTRITFPSPDRTTYDFGDDFTFPQTASAINRQRGTNGYRGDTSAFGAPAAKNYLFGPDIQVTGILANGSRLDLARRAANFINVTSTSPAASCPYLLSWSDSEGWVNHGKALHKGNSKAREYTETIAIDGFRSRFQLEEREPEVAFIDEAKLEIDLETGGTVTLNSDDARISARDGNYLHLYWGDTIEFSFTLPVDVNEEQVIRSRLVLTGYYERYAALRAFGSQPERRGSASSGQRAAGTAMVCKGDDVVQWPTLPLVRSRGLSAAGR
jgi:hypothetical protein